MDPNAMLRAMLEHMAEGERDGAMDALDVLRDWLMGGGLLPEAAARDAVGELNKTRIKRLVVAVRQNLDAIDLELGR